MRQAGREMNLVGLELVLLARHTHGSLQAVSIRATTRGLQAMLLSVLGGEREGDVCRVSLNVSILTKAVDL